MVGLQEELDWLCYEARLERTSGSREISLLEQPTYKRRWYKPDHDAEEREAMADWLADRIEAWARERKEPCTVRQAAAALRSDAALLAVGDRIRADAVPNQKHHVFTADGLLKRAAWEETWRLQHLEDEGRLPKDEQGNPIPIPVPPKYDRTDYQKPDFWSHRGKLDVPKERFIAFTEVPPAVCEEPLYGWPAGPTASAPACSWRWTSSSRTRACRWRAGTGCCTGCGSSCRTWRGSRRRRRGTFGRMCGASWGKRT